MSLYTPAVAAAAGTPNRDIPWKNYKDPIRVRLDPSRCITPQRLLLLSNCCGIPILNLKPRNDVFCCFTYTLYGHNSLTCVALLTLDRRPRHPPL